jgi:hypothetical protein
MSAELTDRQISDLLYDTLKLHPREGIESAEHLALLGGQEFDLLRWDEARGVMYADEQLLRVSREVFDGLPGLANRMVEGLCEVVRRKAETDNPDYKIGSVRLEAMSIWTPVSGVRTRASFGVLMFKDEDSLHFIYDLKQDTLVERDRTIKRRGMTLDGQDGSSLL